MSKPRPAAVRDTFASPLLAVALLAGTAALTVLVPLSVQAQIITTVAGNGHGSTGDGGQATASGIGQPFAVAPAPDGSFYITDGLAVRKVDAAGTISLIAGSDTQAGYVGDGGPALAARFKGVESLAVNAAGELHILDSGNARVRKIDADGNIDTVAGNGLNLFSAEPGPATERPIRVAHAIAFGPDGSLFIADHSSIRKVDTDGIMTRIAGDGSVGFAGDNGPATAAKLSGPTGLAVAADGTVYIADTGNDRLRKIATDGTITSLSNENRPRSLAISSDESSLYYIADNKNYISALVRERLDGIIAGTGVAGYSGDGAGPNAARVNFPQGLAVDAQGRMYIADTHNLRVRRVDFDAVNTAPHLTVSDSIQVAEGDDGTTAISIDWTLDAAASGPVSFTIATQDGGPGSHAPANAGIDYVALPPTPVTVPAGQTSGTFTVTINGDRNVESDQRFDVLVTDIVGAQTMWGSDAISVSVIITNDDIAPPTPFIVRHDQAQAVVGFPPPEISPTGNDTYDWESLAGGSFSLVSAPANGTAVVIPETVSTPLDSRVRYTPAPGFVGTDRFRYRLCNGAGVCKEADVEVFVRFAWHQGLMTMGRMDNTIVGFENPQAREGLVFEATPLVAPIGFNVDLDADLTPGTPWDSDDGTGFGLVTLPPVVGAPVERRVVANIHTTDNIVLLDLYVGIDTNGNGRPDAAEVACSNGQTGNASCEFEVEQGAAGVTYWVMAHSRTSDLASAYLAVFDVPMVAGDGTLVATGPGNLPAGATGGMQLSWRDDSLLTFEQRLGFVRVFTSGGAFAGDVLVQLYRDSGDGEDALQLVPGAATTLRLLPDTAHDRIYFDLPANATGVTVASQSATEVDFYVARQEWPLDASDSGIGAAPAIGSAAVVANAPGGTQSVQVPGTLAPGRWYVVPRNTSTSIADLTLTVTVDAMAPIVRSGSYFNAGRSGHGVFLYPAGDSLAGIWYTYLPDGSATWYYLQGLKPANNGVWTSPVYRSVWHGSHNRLTTIGEAVLTPTGPDTFSFSYTVDGKAGSEPMANLGRGCPVLGGSPLDVSSHWFDPATAGTGYSVQMWPNYEFYAAFVYDARGIARYLLAESNVFGGTEITLDLNQMWGFCPTCTRYATPARVSIGTLRRTLSGGTISRIQVDGIYVDGVPGIWQGDDVVQPLGGPGTTQGCEL